MLDKEKEIARERARNEGKPEKILDRIVEGRMAKFYEEVCLLEQPFVKEATLTIDQLVKTKIAKLGENISDRALRRASRSATSRPPKPAATTRATGRAVEWPATSASC